MVIIRGTSHWNGRENVELDTSTVLQMLGRAGRPQFDKEVKHNTDRTQPSAKVRAMTADKRFPHVGFDVLLLSREWR